ncbi:hypothetical protein LOSG293_110720 [Secundilactobacillus oryzae JCM 18671]|uniref:Uncharacterized protein n=1 Tax=Secundilactobacillus oryzae JCM 18671 TaxID=1291743 RepID=A0A081BI88_9LACO|nr:hypothetical protein LOSG293_110720 [Secundilactobacillus oryzae JCM 18671]
MRKLNKNVPGSDMDARKYIFKGISFDGPAVSKEEYTKHYEEYVARASQIKTSESLSSRFGFHSKPTD